jgi:hypothetical protein
MKKEGKGRRKTERRKVGGKRGKGGEEGRRRYK